MPLSFVRVPFSSVPVSLKHLSPFSVFPPSATLGNTEYVAVFHRLLLIRGNGLPLSFIFSYTPWVATHALSCTSSFDLLLTICPLLFLLPMDSIKYFICPTLLFFTVYLYWTLPLCPVYMDFFLRGSPYLEAGTKLSYVS